MRRAAIGTSTRPGPAGAAAPQQAPAGAFIDPPEAGATTPEGAVGSTRERLLAAAIELVEQGGYGSASVSAIARRAGVADGTLYRHFASKAELFVAVFRKVCSGELAAMREAADDAAPSDRLDAVIETFARRALKNRRMAWALVAEPIDPLVDAERLAFRETYMLLFAELIAQGIERGDLPGQNVELTAAGMVGAIAEMLIGPLAPIGTPDRPALADADAIVAAQITFCRRAAGAHARTAD